MDPAVSIIVPNYNYAKFLDKRISSILEQSFQDFELILLDDASTDNRIEVRERYKDNPHVTHYVANEQNSGSPFRQWEKGVNLAKGKYIWIAESDDYADPDLLKKTIALLEKYPTAHLCFCGGHIIDDTEKEIDDFDSWSMPSYKSDNGDGIYIIDSGFYLKHYMIWNNCIYNASGAIFRKSAIKPSSFKDVISFRYCGDWLFWSSIISGGDVIITKEKLNYFRLHSQSATAKALNSGATMLESLYIIRHNIRNVNFMRQLIRIGTLHRDIRRGVCVFIDIKWFNPEYFRVFGKVKGVLAIIVERINKLLLPILPCTITRTKDFKIPYKR